MRAADAGKIDRIWDDFYESCLEIILRAPDVRKLSEFDREDVAHEVMVDVVRRIGDGPAELDDGLRAWIYVLSRNKAVDVVRRRYRRPEVGFDDGSGETVPDSGPSEARRDAVEDDMAAIWEALGALDGETSMPSYVIFFLRTVQRWEVGEIAEMLQMPADQVRARCHRVKKKLQEMLEARNRGEGADS